MVNELLEKIILSEYLSPNELIDIQLNINEIISNYERKIVNARHRIKRLKSAKKKYGKLDNKSINKINKYEQVIQNIKAKEDELNYQRGKIKFLGDCLVYRIYDEFDIRQLAKNDDPGFSYGKDGNSLEIETLKSFYNKDIPVILHDITNCLRIGDVSFLNENGKPSLIECKSINSSKSEMKISDRFMRQIERMDAVITTFNSQNEVASDILTDEKMFEYGMPKKIIEVDTQLEFYYKEYEEICNNTSDFSIIEIEEGLIYGLSHIDCIDNFYIECSKKYKDRQLVPSNLLRRVEGEFINVTPFAIGFTDINNVLKIFNAELVAFVFIDLEYIIQEFNKKGYEIKIYHDESHDISSIELVGKDIELGPRLLNSVQYGLLSLRSAIDFMTFSLTTNQYEHED